MSPPSLAGWLLLGAWALGLPACGGGGAPPPASPPPASDPPEPPADNLRFGVGDALPGVPSSGSFVPRLTAGGASVSTVAGVATVAMGNGGYIETQGGIGYTCRAAGGCRIEDGVVAQGAVVRGQRAAAPDLAVQGASADPADPYANAPLALSATVRNAGAGASAATTLRWRRSADGTISASDAEVGTAQVGELAAGASQDAALGLAAPADAGTHFYGACADPVAGEADDANNCSAPARVTVRARPDLAVQGASADPADPYANAPLALSATVRNAGAGASAATTLRWRRSADDTISASDAEVGTAQVGELAAGASQDAALGLAAPADAGTHFYGACADPVAGEADDANNCSAPARVTVLARPDLAVGPASADPADPYANAPLALSATVRNAGAGASSATTLRWRRSADDTISASDAEVGTAQVGELAAGASQDAALGLQAPALAGTHFYGACADAVAGEADDANNCSAPARVTVRARPDLAVGPASADPADPYANAPLALSATVRNAGAGASSATTLRWRRSADDTISASDAEVGTAQVGELAAGASQDAALDLAAPADAGTHFYGACADAVAGEADDANNCSAPARVTVLARPDLAVQGASADPADPYANAPLALSATVRNAGAGASAATTLRWRRSADGTISASDAEVGTAQVGELAAGASQDAALDLAAPADAGTHFYGACADAVAGEADDANNCSAPARVTVLARPDLAVGPASADPADPYANAPLALSATVRNAGAGASAATTLRWRRSADGTISASDAEVGTAQVGELAAGASQDAALDLAAPADAGTHFYGACADAVAGEADDANNCSAPARVTVRARPDLAVQGASADPADPYANAPLALSATVRNAGAGASAATTLRWRRSADGTISASDAEVGTAQVGELAAGASQDAALGLAAPADAGIHFYGACADPVAGEADDANNCSAPARVTVRARPDLAVQGASADPADPYANAPLALSATVRNAGAGASAATTLRWRRSADGTISASDAEVGTAQVGELAAGASQDAALGLAAPADAGTHFYGACADPVAGEADDANNCSAPARVTVLARPDLAVGPASADPADPYANAPLALSATVRNAGAGASSATTLRWRRSADDTISASDAEVGTAQVGELAAGETSEESLGLQAPALAGIHYYGACADAVAGEADDANNCSAPARVTVLARPDLAVGPASADPADPYANAPLALSATVRNAGAGASSATTLRWRRSADGTISASDAEVGTAQVGELAAGASQDAALGLQAPALAGTHFYGACADAVAGEADDANNCSAPARVTVRARPDLAVGPASADPADPYANAPLALSATVRNAGAGASSATTLRWRRSADGTISASDAEVGTAQVGELAAGASQDAALDLAAPADAGTHFYGACADAVAGEADDANNCSAPARVTVLARPDLAVQGASADPADPYANAPLALSATVRNAGAGASAATTLRWRRSADGTISASDAEVGTAQVGELAAGASQDAALDLAAPADAGTHFYGACADAVAGEADDANNCSAPARVTVLARPDLAVGPASADPADPYANAPLALSATVRNAGAGASAATTLRWRRSADGTISASDAEVGTAQVGELAAGASQDAALDLAAPADAGTHFYGACADAVAGEADDANNCSAPARVTVLARPDLAVQGASADPADPYANAPLALSATVRNAGAGASAATTLRWRRSADGTISASDAEVGTAQVGELAAGASQDAALDLAAPADAGTHFYGACADAVAGEADDANNCSAPARVTVLARPDLAVGPASADPADPYANAPLALSATVRNAGAGASAATTLRWRRSADGTISASDAEVGTAQVGELAAGASQDAALDLAAPADAGTHFYGACADPVAGEADDANNCSAPARVTVLARPDLAVQGASADPADPYANAPLALSATVRNAGAGASSATTLRWRRSADDTISASDAEVGTAQVGELAAGASQDAALDLAAPALAGIHYYGACADAVAGEADDANNCSAPARVTVLARPDLAVGPASADPADPYANAPLALSATVRNAGAGASSATTLRWRRSADDTISASDAEVGTAQVGELAAGASQDAALDLAAPADAGTHFYGACADPVAGEADDANNCSAPARVTVLARPDLAVQGASADPADPYANAPLALSATVRNAGAGASSATTLRWRRSADGTISASDAEVGTAQVGELAAGETSEESLGLQAPALAGIHYYGACADPVAGESDIANNCSAAVAVTVAAAPDLAVGPASANPAPVAAGARLSLSATVSNVGAAPSSAATLRWYRSADGTISASDAEVGSGQVGELAAGGSSDESIVLSAPASPGTYHYGACVDAVAGESSAANNCSGAVAVAVAVAGPPDLAVLDVDASADFLFLSDVGSDTTLSATVRNLGGARAAATTLRWQRFRVDGPYPARVGEVGAAPVAALAALAASSGSIVRSVPADPGFYVYFACVDPVAGESDTANNCSYPASVDIIIATGGPPDLSVSGVEASTPVAGRNFTLSADVVNLGGVRAAATTLRWHASDDAAVSPLDTQVGVVPVDPVDPVLALGGSSESIDLPSPAAPGIHYYGACVDAVAGESSAANNCGAVAVIVTSGPPDLVVALNASTPSGLDPGGLFFISALAYNLGGVEAAATTLRWYVSDDAAVSTSDTEVGAGPVAALAPGGLFEDGAIILSAPANPGTYHYGACADPVAGEADDANNCSGAVAVTVRERPDLAVRGARAAAASAFGLDGGNGHPRGMTHAGGRLFVVDDIDDEVYAYSTTGQRDAAAGFGLVDGNGDPAGIAHAGGRLFVVDSADGKVYAYSAAGRRDPAADFDLGAGNDDPAGIAHAGGRLFVVDSADGKVYAYSAAGRRDPAADFDLGAGNDDPAGIAHAGGRLFVVDSEDGKAYAYSATGLRDAAADFGLDAGNGGPWGIAHAGGWLLVADRAGGKVFAYPASGLRDAAADFDLDAVNGSSRGIAHAGGRLLVVDILDDKVYAYSATGQRDAAADFDLDAENAGATGIAHAGGRLLVVDALDDKVYAYSATGQRDPAADFDLDAENADATGIAHAAGRLLLVDFVDDKVYAYSTTGQRDPAADFDLGAGNNAPTGIAHAGGRLLVVDWTDDKVYAYSTTGQRDPAADFGLDAGGPGGIAHAGGRLLVVDWHTDKVYAHSAAGQLGQAADFGLGGNDHPAGIARAGGRLFVVDALDDKVYAYSATGQRDEAAGFGLDAENADATGIAHAAGRLLVVDFIDDKVYAYSTTGQRDPAADFGLDAGNGDPGGIAHAAGRLLVVDRAGGKVFAYSTTGQRDPAADFDLGAGNSSAEGIAHAGGRLFVVDSEDGKAYAYSAAGRRDPAADFELHGRAPAGIAHAGGQLLVVDWLDEGVRSYPVPMDAAGPGAPVDASPGAPLTLFAAVRNAGAGASTPTTLRWYRSADAAGFEAVTQVGSDQVGALAAGASEFETLALLAPADEGTYFYGACADPVAGESSAANNCSGSVAVAVRGRPDLAVGPASADPASLPPGAPLALSATVSNAGGAASSATTLRWYRSANGTISASDAEVGANDVGALAAGGSSEESLDLQAPAGLGTHFYGACAAPVAGEPDASNNCSGAAAVTVRAGLAPPDQAGFDALFAGSRMAPSASPDRLDFVSPGRFRETDSAETRTGSHAWTRTGADAGMLELRYDDGGRCAVALTLTSAGRGTSDFPCGDGTAGASAVRIEPIPPLDLAVRGARAAAAGVFDLGAGNNAPTGIAHAGGRLLVVDWADDKVYAYSAAGQRDPAADFGLDAENGNPDGIARAGGRLYVVDGADDKVYAYSVAGQRDAAADFGLGAGNGDPQGIAHAGGRLLVVDWFDRKAYAYSVAGQRDAAADFDLGGGNDAPTGIAHAGGRLFVVDWWDEKVYAYSATGQRDPAADFDLHGRQPAGVAHAGGRLIVLSRKDLRVDSYPFPMEPGAPLTRAAPARRLTRSPARRSRSSRESGTSARPRPPRRR